jgi:hypothetical protein
MGRRQKQYRCGSSTGAATAAARARVCLGASRRRCPWGHCNRRGKGWLRRGGQHSAEERARCVGGGRLFGACRAQTVEMLGGGRARSVGRVGTSSVEARWVGRVLRQARDDGSDRVGAKVGGAASERRRRGAQMGRNQKKAASPLPLVRWARQSGRSDAATGGTAAARAKRREHWPSSLGPKGLHAGGVAQRDMRRSALTKMVVRIAQRDRAAARRKPAGKGGKGGEGRGWEGAKGGSHLRGRG